MVQVSGREGGRRSQGSLPSSPPCGLRKASGFSHKPNIGGEPSPDWWDLVHPGQVAEAGQVDIGVA